MKSEIIKSNTMKKYFLSLLFSVLLVNINYTQNVMDKKLKQFFDKDSVTILITESGLGGLSITSEVDCLIQKHKSFKNARIIFYNSQPEDSIGYNGMKTIERKAGVFNNALEGMVKWFKPDIILIACNTLSVVYEKTEFSKRSDIPPVVGIVDFGVDMIYSKMKRDKNSSIIIFGTPTTIAANSHKNKLIEKGIDPDRIITSSCDHLPGAIEQNVHSEKTRSIISRCIDSAAKKIKDKNGKVYLGFCCTHFGYANDVFLKEASIFKNKETLNPNSRMSNFIIKKEKTNKSTTTSVEIHSRANLTDVEINSIGSLIKESSPKTERALKNYNLKKDLFEFEP